VKPLLAKAVIRPSRFKKGAGNVLASLKFAVVESLLPNSTFHLCPPSYTSFNLGYYRINI